jgi:DNA-directed RNA polymerase specialized sigma24 family protein
MEQRKLKWREPASAAQVDQLLASRYGQLLQWASGLTRGDAGKSEEIVQEFCLYFTLTKPDLSGVANLDGYLYTSLRHIYLSGLARSSREALRFVSIAEFDSFASALDDASGDALQKQNDLRRICGYTVWRKESSKSASYFILHFFHGYGRREIAELGCVPMSAIYNKLKIARAEVKSHLQEAGKLRIVNRDLPPEPALPWGLCSSEDLFRELRKTILQARNTGCLPEEELLAYYCSSTPRPISCALLAHIVSCERCLNTVDRQLRRPTLKDREPLDCFGMGSEEGSDSVAEPGPISQKAMLQAVRKRWDRVHEHRPRTLSIAVNGQIVAFHDVHAEHSKLSARIERPENAMFVEVFSEQDVRLALLSIGELPPDGSRVRTQRVELSDARWLELSLTFDGLGLNGEVAYFDPALAAEVGEEDTEESLAVLPFRRDAELVTPGLHGRNAIYEAFRRMLLAMTPSSTLGWSLALAILLTAGYLAYQRTSGPADAMEILNRSVVTETAALQGQTEHQVLNIEEVSSNGSVLQQGVVDLWKDGDGNRYLRRLFDAKHRMVAAEWRNKSGEHSVRRKEGGKAMPEGARPPLMSGLWDHDLSAQAFRGLGGRAPRLRPVEDGYELTTAGPIEGHPQVISATLVLDRHLVPVRTVLRVQAGTDVHELRFVQASYERRPRGSVPDAMFDPEYFSSVRDLHSTATHAHALPATGLADFALAELQIAVLYQLSRLQADTSQPIEVMRTSDGHIRVSGALADDALKRKIVTQLQALPNHERLDLKLLSPQEVRRRPSAAPRLIVRSTSVYEINQEKSAADETLRKYFQGKGISGERLDAAVAQFSHDALEHAQRALQNAYALDRLGGALSAAELQSINLSSQQHWTEMIDKHAQTLEEQLRLLDQLLAEISGDEAEDTGNFPAIADPAQFKQVADQLLHQTQDLNRDVGAVFTSTPSAAGNQNVQWAAMVRAIPLRQAEEIARFGVQLHASAVSASTGNVHSTPGHSR